MLSVALHPAVCQHPPPPLDQPPGWEKPLPSPPRGHVTRAGPIRILPWDFVHWRGGVRPPGDKGVSVTRSRGRPEVRHRDVHCHSYSCFQPLLSSSLALVCVGHCDKVPKKQLKEGKNVLERTVSVCRQRAPLPHDLAARPSSSRTITDEVGVLILPSPLQCHQPGTKP
jgi:hypothetical protein